MKALVENGVDENKRIVGTGAPTPYLYNLPPELVERFRKQVSVVDLIGCTDPRRRRLAAATKRRRRGSTATCSTTPERIQNRQSSTRLRGRCRNLGWKLRGRKFHRTWEVGGASLDELKETLKLPDKDLNYHLSVLESVKLVKRDENFVSVTPEGVALLKFQQKRK